MDLNAQAQVLLPPHPFYPVEREIVGYVANHWSVLELLASFAAVSIGLLSLTLGLIRQSQTHRTASEATAILWFVFTGSIHLFFEGYFVVNHMRISGMQDLFAQLWKEYSLSDSRYLTSDTFVLCVEGITAFLWGPLSFVIAWSIITNHPRRYPLQILVSTGQLFGVVLYYATSMFEYYYKGLSYWRPEGCYFWCYYFAMNFIWIAIPGYFLFRGFDASIKAFRALEWPPTDSKNAGKEVSSSKMTE